MFRVSAAHKQSFFIGSSHDFVLHRKFTRVDGRALRLNSVVECSAHFEVLAIDERRVFGCDWVKLYRLRLVARREEVLTAFVRVTLRGLELGTGKV